MPYYIYEARDRDDKLLYIGQAVNPEHREKQHRRVWATPDVRFRVIEEIHSSQATTDWRENTLIQELKPVRNKKRAQPGYPQDVLDELIEGKFIIQHHDYGV